MDLTLEIFGWVESLEDALTQFTSAEDLDGENMYRCGRFVDPFFFFLLFEKTQNIALETRILLEGWQQEKGLLTLYYCFVFASLKTQCSGNYCHVISFAIKCICILDYNIFHLKGVLHMFVPVSS